MNYSQHMKKKYNKRDKNMTNIFYYLACILDEDNYNYKIHIVDIRKTLFSYNVKIYLERPGIFIGKAGNNMNKVKTKLEKFVKKEISISISDYKALPIPTFDLY